MKPILTGHLYKATKTTFCQELHEVGLFIVFTAIKQPPKIYYT